MKKTFFIATFTRKYLFILTISAALKQIFSTTDNIVINEKNLFGCRKCFNKYILFFQNEKYLIE